MGEPLSGANPRVKRLAALAARRRARVEEGAYLIEGPTLVADALAAGIELEAVYAEGSVDPQLLAAARSAGVPTVEVATGALARVVDVVTPRPVAAVARRPTPGVAAVPLRGPVLVLVGVSDPGNAGTLMRSAEGAGFGAVLCTDGTVDPWSPKVVRASAGSVFRLPVVEGGGVVQVLETVGATGRTRLGTRVGNAQAYDEVPLDAAVAVVLGNEAHGLAPEAAAHVDRWAAIPLAGRTESLNVAMAGTVLCFEVARRLRHAP